MTRRVVAALAAALALLTGCGESPDPAGTPLLVAGAADLKPAFEELGALFTERTGQPVTFTFGSSGQLAQQIVNGAPFEVFASANVSFVDKVVDTGRARAESKHTYAFGRVVVWVREGSPHGTPALADLTDPRYRRVAVANPDHAPYGTAAVQALRSSGLYEQVQPRLVYGENVSDTLRLASSGNADAALVALSLAIATPGGRYALVDEDAHEPLEQALAVTATSAERARLAQRFADLVSSPQGREVMARYGFTLPGGG